MGKRKYQRITRLDYHLKRGNISPEEVLKKLDELSEVHQENLNGLKKRLTKSYANHPMTERRRKQLVMHERNIDKVMALELKAESMIDGRV
jgi:hypothetical protein